jgi:hypothetical protein
LSADCDTCWAANRGPVPAHDALALDWVAPSDREGDAPLSTVALRDATDRLAHLKLAAPSKTSAVHAITRSQRIATLRVAHGLPFNGYIGASIEMLRPLHFSGAYTVHLALVETIAASAEGNAMPRNIVRNVLQAKFNGRKQLSKSELSVGKPYFESRPMSIPPGTNPDRLSVVGWVQNEAGQLLAVAQSRCMKPLQ